MKKVLLFDLDDTLLDFQAAEKFALGKVFTKYGVTATPENVVTYQTINHRLWKKYEVGEIARTDITNSRFPQFFAAIANTGDGLQAESDYRSFLGLAKVEVPGARALLESLAADYTLCLVTNGVADTQKARLKNTGFGQYFTKVFIAEELGVQKPEPAFFEQVAAALPNFSKREMLVIGDSLTSDIAGGNNSQIETAWFNPQHLLGTVPATYEFAALPELPRLLQQIS